MYCLLCLYEHTSFLWIKVFLQVQFYDWSVVYTILAVFQPDYLMTIDIFTLQFILISVGNAVHVYAVHLSINFLSRSFWQILYYTIWNVENHARWRPGLITKFLSGNQYEILLVQIKYYIYWTHT